MIRFLASAGIAIVVVASLNAQGITIRVLGGDEDSLVVDEQVAVTRNVPQQRTRIVDGKQVVETVTVPVLETRTVQKKVPLKDVPIYDLDGVRVAPEKIAEMFKKPRAVVMSPTAKVSPPLKEVLKEGTLVVVMASRTPALMPAPPLPGK